MLVVDLIKGKDGYFTYERIIPTATGKAVVCIPVFENRFILMEHIFIWSKERLTSKS